MLYVERTEPIWGPLSEPPNPPSNVEEVQLEARVGAFGSSKVLERYQDFRKAVISLHGHVRHYRDMRERGRDTAKDRREMDEAREAVRKEVGILEAAIRTELTTLA